LSSHEDEQQQTELEEVIKQAADNEDEELQEDDQMSLGTYFPRQEIKFDFDEANIIHRKFPTRNKELDF
jgi:hypothetical protein